MISLPSFGKVRTKSVVADAREVGRAVDLIRMGARLQVLESEIALSRERLLRLYKEVAGASPSKGMLPFSTDWFMTWQPNIHSSLFINLYNGVSKAIGIDRVDALVKAFRLYQEHLHLCGLPEVLSVTRAWRLVKFCEAGMLDSASCTECGGRFVIHKYEPITGFVCGLCNPPARAGKTRTGSLQARLHPANEGAVVRADLVTQ
ncbi:MAG: flagellar transcriptional regulator FlhC [Burkholderiales bacterium]